jgi:superfamily II DNA or RNA helicase
MDQLILDVLILWNNKMSGFESIQVGRVWKSNVVVSTMNILTSLNTIEKKTLLNEHFFYLFIDEVHHSEARYSKLINR